MHVETKTCGHEYVPFLKKERITSLRRLTESKLKKHRHVMSGCHVVLQTNNNVRYHTR